MGITKRKYSKLKKTFIVLALLLAGFFIYVEIANRNSVDMTYRQKVLKAVYPAFIWVTKLFGKNSATLSKKNVVPPVSFYSLHDTDITGKAFDFEKLKGKKILLVNTASDCGYTNQYADLEKLAQQYQGKLVVIGFPANDFKEQEKGEDKAIAEFCKVNYGVTFPLMTKSSVIKSDHQDSVFQWLTNANKNGWNDQEPTWNFCKYLVDENGRLANFFASSVEPFNANIINALNQ